MQAREAMSECELHVAACEHKPVRRCEFACAQTKLCAHRAVQVCADMFLQINIQIRRSIPRYINRQADCEIDRYNYYIDS